jgi:hypothetical protein
MKRRIKRDSIILRGNEIIAQIRSGTVSNNLPINNTSTNIGLKPYSFGDRVALLASVYTRYRIKSITFSYKTHVGSTINGALALGVADDSNTSDIVGNIGGIYDNVVNLRCSNDSVVWKDFSFDWIPLDPKKWYYTDTSGRDPTFETQGTLLAAYDVNRTDNLYLGEIRARYVVEFEGAKPVYAANLQSTKNDTMCSNMTEPGSTNHFHPLRIERGASGELKVFRGTQK